MEHKNENQEEIKTNTEDFTEDSMGETRQASDEEWMDGLADELIDIPEKTGMIRRIIDVFINPKKLAKNINYHQGISSAIIFFIIIGLLSAPFISKVTEITTEASMKSMQEIYGADFLDFYKSMEEMQGISITPEGGGSVAPVNDGVNPMNIVAMAVGILSTVIQPLLFTLLSAFYYNLGSKLMGGEATYGKMYSFILHAACITVLGNLLFYISAYLLESHINIFSLAILSDGNVFSTSYLALSVINVFTLWYLAVIVIGLKEIAKISTTRAIILVAIGLVVTIGIAILSSKLSLFAIDSTFNMLEQGN